MAQNDQKIAELYGEFKLKFDKVQADLDRLKSKTEKSAGKAGKSAGDKFEKGFSSYVKKIGLALGGVFAVQKLTSWLSGISQAQDRIQKLSIRLGETTNFLSEMQYVADLSGVSVEELNNAIERGNRNLAEFAETGAGEASDAFTKLGIEAKNSEGKLKSFEELLPEYAKGFAGIADNSEKVNLAFKLFGRSGTAMLQIFDAGADGIEAMRQKARDLGISLDQDAADKTAKLNDTIGTLSKAFTGLGYVILDLVGTPLKKLVEGMTDVVIAIRKVVDAWKDAATWQFLASKQGVEYIKDYVKAFVTSDISNIGARMADATSAATIENLEALKIFFEQIENLKKKAEGGNKPTGGSGGYGFSNKSIALPDTKDTKIRDDNTKVWQDYLKNIKNVETEYFTLSDTFDEVQEASSEFYAGLMADTQGYMEAGNMLYESMIIGFETMFNDLIKIETSSNNTLIKGFVAMANAFVQQLQRMIAQWLAFKAIQAGLNLLVPGAGDLWSKLASKNAQTGAEFYVPPGYPNDTYMMGVSSGEHVQVTPSSQPNNQDKLLQKMISRLDILASYANAPQGVQGVNVTGRIDGYDIKLAYDKMNKLVNKVS